MPEPTIKAIMTRAREIGVVIPAFNVPYLEMVEPVMRAAIDRDAFILVETARGETKAEGGLAAVKREFDRCCNLEYARLHLDHVPVIDASFQKVDYMPVFEEAIALGFHSVMVDGSRLPLEENIQATAQVVALAHKTGIPCEAELGRVLGHEAGPPPPYEELFNSGMGFTVAAEAERFVKETGCDWLSVAIGSIHGSVSEALRDRKKVAARLNLEHLQKLSRVTGIPLVLHGGSGVQRDYVLGAVKLGIAKMNIGTEIRQAYDAAFKEGGVGAAKQAVYDRVCWSLSDYLGVAGRRKSLLT